MHPKTFFRKLSFILLRSHRMCLRWKIVTLITTLIIGLTLTAYLSKMKFTLAAEDLADPDIASVETLKKLNENFGDRTSCILLVLPPSGQKTYTAKELCELQEWYHLERAKNPEVISSLSLFIGAGSRLGPGTKIEAAVHLDVLTDLILKKSVTNLNQTLTDAQRSI